MAGTRVIKVPDVGEGIHEGEIVAFHVGVGDHVEEHDAMLDVMTDKTTVAIGAPCTGTVCELWAEVGASVRVAWELVSDEAAE